MRIGAVLLSLMALCLATCGSQVAPDASTFSMEIGSLSPVEVGVLTPSKKFIYTYTNEFRCRGTTTEGERIYIEPAGAVGYYWNPHGARLELAVFEEVGVYTIYVSDNLETETENSFTITKEYVSKNAHKIAVIPGSCKGVKTGVRGQFP